MSPTIPDITQVFQYIVLSVISVSVAAITYELVKLARVRYKMWEATLSSQQLAFLQTGVAAIVRFVEQSGINGAIANAAEAKKAEAVKAAQKFCDDNNLPFDVAAIEVAIEDAIRQGLHKITTENSLG